MKLAPLLLKASGCPTWYADDFPFIVRAVVSALIPQHHSGFLPRAPCDGGPILVRPIQLPAPHAVRPGVLQASLAAPLPSAAAAAVVPVNRKGRPAHHPDRPAA